MSKKTPTALPPDLIFLLNIEKTVNGSGSESDCSGIKNEYFSDSD
jgi:hypothetical protein